MKTTLMHCLAAIGLLASLGTQVSAQTFRLRADIPFEFKAGETTLPAGTYVIESTRMAGVLLLSGAEGQKSLYLACSTKVATKDAPSELRFRRYNNNYFLASASTTWNDGVHIELPKTRLQKEQALLAQSRSELVIMARR